MRIRFIIELPDGFSHARVQLVGGFSHARVQLVGGFSHARSNYGTSVGRSENKNLHTKNNKAEEHGTRRPKQLSYKINVDDEN